MGRCEDLVGLLKRNEVTRRPMRRNQDPYTLAGDLLRAFESVIRRGLDPRRDRREFLERIQAEIIKFYSSKRMERVPNLEDVRRVGERILEQIASMESKQREICSLYFALKATGNRNLERLLAI